MLGTYGPTYPWCKMDSWCKYVLSPGGWQSLPPPLMSLCDFFRPMSPRVKMTLIWPETQKVVLSKTCRDCRCMTDKPSDISIIYFVGNFLMCQNIFEADLSVIWLLPRVLESQVLESLSYQCFFSIISIFNKRKMNKNILWNRRRWRSSNSISKIYAHIVKL